MKIAVIGANGRSGQALVKRALNSGYEVRGGIRGESRLPDHPNLTIQQCDATNEDDVRQLLVGQDAVVSLIGHVRHSPKDVQSIAISNVIKVMKETGMTRLISMTGTGVRFPGDKVGLLGRLMNLILVVFAPPRVKDGRKHARLLQATDLEWTIIRVQKLQNSEPKPYTLREHGPTKFSVSREEVAVAILEVLERRSFIRQAPMIGKP